MKDLYKQRHQDVSCGIHNEEEYMMIEGSLEAKLPTIWRDGNGTARKKLGRGESQQEEDKRWRRSEMEKVRREKMQVREKVGKSRNTVFFQCFVAPEGR